MESEVSSSDHNVRLVSISSATTSLWTELNDIWNYRELLYFLTLRDIRIRYNNTFIGILWVVLKPLSAVIVFTFLFSKVARIESQELPYPIFAFAGIAPWFFFSNTVSNCSNSLISNSNLITKVYFPRLIIPAAALVAGLVDFCITLVFMFSLMLYYDLRLSYTLVLLPFLVIVTSLLTLSAGILTSALTVKYRDVQHILPFLLQLMMFATPVLYPPSLIPPALGNLVYVNPWAGIIEGYRAVISGRLPDIISITISLLVTLIITFFSTWYFRRTEHSFADII